MTDSNPNPKKKVIALIAAALSFIVTYFLIQKVLFSAPPLNKALMQAASDINKSCPFMVDNVTRLDNVVAGTDKDLQYNYTLVSMDRSTIDTNLFKKTIEPLLINNVRTMPSMKTFRDKEVTMIYSYKDKQGLFVTRIIITPEKYMGK